MPSSTPIYALPYPLGTDRVMDGDDAIHALADRVEAVLQQRDDDQMFNIVVTVPANAAFATLVPIPFPVAFAVVPAVIGNVSGTSAAPTNLYAGFIATPYQVSTTQFGLRVDKVVGAPLTSATQIRVSVHARVSRNG